ncbi:hypothetical protein J6590_053288 [Homalodisca vitripennis]|nr:hypothetical protein J6590_053288 [Homalodisca vitripennis]
MAPGPDSKGPPHITPPLRPPDLLPSNCSIYPPTNLPSHSYFIIYLSSYRNSCCKPVPLPNIQQHALTHIPHHLSLP